MYSNTVQIIDNGLKCLSKHLGARETEIFITTMLQERFDYTEWRKNFVEEIDTFDKLEKLIKEKI